MPKFLIRRMGQDDSFAPVADLLNTIRTEPTTSELLREEEEQVPPGKLHYNEAGELAGWDRPKWLAEDGKGNIVGFAMVSRAPWTEPGLMEFTLVIRPEVRGSGAGTALYDVTLQWAEEVKASRLITLIRDQDESSVAFANRRGYTAERHIFESVLDLSAFDGGGALFDSIGSAEQAGISFTTLADEPGEESERKLYELYKATEPDIPGYSGDYPWFEEWRKWTIGRAGVRPELVRIARDGDRFIGVATLLQNEQTGAMYHEYTGVLREYRCRRIALALKLLAVRRAMASGVPYLRTNNDSMNVPMLRINRDLIGFRAEPGMFKMVKKLR
ncbi:GNAT family N-acetyltransferase [Paenibacillus sp. M1]|uniref:GNAT family N-acetyltransferase n=1 Tax=Paenibacillus haidiansis TaxID=1574488 RepID=A0ABU7VPV0_9BACL